MKKLLETSTQPRPKLIQNGVQLKHNSQLVISSYRHDYQPFHIPIEDGVDIYGAVDGGQDYLRRVGAAAEVQYTNDLSVLNTDPFEVHCDLLTVGVINKDGTKDYAFIKDLPKKQLQKIKDSVRESKAKVCPYRLAVVDHFLTK